MSLQVNARFENDEIVFSGSNGEDWFALTLDNKIHKISPISSFVNAVYPWNDFITNCIKSVKLDNLPKQFKDLDFKAILTFIQAPVLEKLFRCNLKNLYQYAYDECKYYNEFPTFMKNPEKLSTVFHLNNHQLKIINDRKDIIESKERSFVKCESIFGALSKLYNGNIGDLDEKSFTDLLSAYILIKREFTNIDNYLEYDLKLSYNLFVKAESMNRLKIFCDSIRIYKSLSKKMIENDKDLSNYQKLFKFSNTSELDKLHNFLVEVKNIEAVEAEAERCNNLDKKLKNNKALLEKREKLYYEDQDYVIFAPEKMIDIVWEGKKLQHCVAGYVDSVASGQTTILFLRKKPDIEIPFYTIEVGDGKVIQIHGFGNKWLGNDSDAIPTVVAWAKKNKLNVTKQILCGLGCSFSGSSNYAKIPDRKSIEIIKKEKNKDIEENKK